MVKICVHNLQTCLIILAVVCGFSVNVQPTRAADIYKWVDETGKVHYDDRPTQASSKRMHVNTTPPSDPDWVKRGQWRDKLLKVYDEERTEREALAKKERADTKERQANCVKARTAAQNYDSISRIYDVDDNGERVYLDEGAMLTEKKQVHRAVADWCG